jgi:hypothetical protein
LLSHRRERQRAGVTRLIRERPRVTVRMILPPPFRRRTARRRVTPRELRTDTGGHPRSRVRLITRAAVRQPVERREARALTDRRCSARSPRPEEIRSVRDDSVARPRGRDRSRGGGVRRRRRRRVIRQRPRPPRRAETRDAARRRTEGHVAERVGTDLKASVASIESIGYTTTWASGSRNAIPDHHPWARASDEVPQAPAVPSRRWPASDPSLPCWR